MSSLTQSLSCGKKTLDKRLELEPGQYVLTATYDESGALANGNASLRVTFEDSIGVVKSVRVGGLRIRRTVSHAGAGAADVVKEYRYRMSGEPDRSSGCALSDVPTYNYQFRTEVGLPGATTLSGPAATCTYSVRTSTGLSDAGLTQGSPVGYREVTVLEGPGGSGGKTSYKYTAAYHYGDAGNPNFPFAPSTSYDYRRGKLVEATTYRRTEGGFEPVKRTRHAYSFATSTRANPQQRVRGLKVGYRLDAKWDQNDDFAVRSYAYVAEWLHPTRTVVRRYALADTTRYAETTTTYYYGNERHLQLTGQRQVASNGSTLSTVYRYPLDFTLPPGPTPAGPTTGLATLVNRHLLGAVIEQQQWRRTGSDSVLVGARLTHYEGLRPKRLLQLTAPDPVAAGAFAPAGVAPGGAFD